MNFSDMSNKQAPEWNLWTQSTTTVSLRKTSNGNVALDNYGVWGVGDAFGSQPTPIPTSRFPVRPIFTGFNTFTMCTCQSRHRRASCAETGRRLTGQSAHHAAGKTPNNCAQSAANPTGCGGFTVGSENPVYILGNYNSNCYTAGDPTALPATPQP